jgi:hypothetical protein
MYVRLGQVDTSDGELLAMQEEVGGPPIYTIDGPSLPTTTGAGPIPLQTTPSTLPSNLLFDQPGGQVLTPSTPAAPAAPSSPTVSVSLGPSTGSVAPIVLPNGVAINPASLTAAQLAMTPAQLQASLCPGAAPSAPAPAPFNLSTWLSQSTIISGLSNQAVALGGLLFGGALAIIVSTKKKK